MIEWIPRYSDTEEYDRQGRWARMGVYKNISVAWIYRSNFKGKDIFSCSEHFPSTYSANPCIHFIAHSWEEARERVEKDFKEFLKKVGGGNGVAMTTINEH